MTYSNQSRLHNEQIYRTTKGKKIDLWLLNKYAIRDALYIARCAYLPWTTMQLRGPSRPQVSVIGYKLM